jgi:hypothetical protein
MLLLANLHNNVDKSTKGFTPRIEFNENMLGGSWVIPLPQTDGFWQALFKNANAFIKGDVLLCLHVSKNLCKTREYPADGELRHIFIIRYLVCFQVGHYGEFLFTRRMWMQKEWEYIMLHPYYIAPYFSLHDSRLHLPLLL